LEIRANYKQLNNSMGGKNNKQAASQAGEVIITINNKQNGRVLAG